eukprot:8860751-Karenia_brevis.AAC.1
MASSSSFVEPATEHFGDSAAQQPEKFAATLIAEATYALFVNEFNKGFANIEQTLSGFEGMGNV